MNSRLLGCDFSSLPSRKKPIVLAFGALQGERLVLTNLERIESLQDYALWLKRSENWLGAFDFPFGLPRELVEHLNWPLKWEDCIRHYARMSRQEIRNAFAAFCAARPVGGKFAHRKTDLLSGSSPSMKWVNPPVAYMLHAGVPPLIDAGVVIPGLWPNPDFNAQDMFSGGRFALEAYPGLLARELLGNRSYKSDDKAKQSPERLIARKDLITALEHGQTRLGLRLKLTHAQRDQLIDDPTADSLDAVLCLTQAAWASQRGFPGYGLPPSIDPLEGWIVTAGL